jgi:hypothetical protein
MAEEPREYQSYLLRLWRTSSQGKSTWRASLARIQTGELSGLADLGSLFAFLEQQTGRNSRMDGDRLALNRKQQRDEVMRRVVLLLAIGFLTALSAVGTWLASRPPILLSFPPDATDLHMAANSWWEWTLSYRTPDSSNQWYSTTVHQLETDGWMESSERYVGGPPHTPATYTRMTSFGFVVIWERVELDGDAHRAHLRMYRWITIQPLRLVYQR